MVRCVANWNDGKWTKIIDWHDDDLKEIAISRDDWRRMYGPPNTTGLDIIGIVYFADKPEKDFDCKEKCF